MWSAGASVMGRRPSNIQPYKASVWVGLKDYSAVSLRKSHVGLYVVLPNILGLLPVTAYRLCRAPAKPLLVDTFHITRGVLGRVLLSSCQLGSL